MTDNLATSNFIEEESLQYNSDLVLDSGPKVQVENRNEIVLHSPTKVPLAKEISNTVQYSFIFENLKASFLILIEKLCDDDCLALFFKYYLQIIKHHKKSSQVRAITMDFGQFL